MMAVVCALWVTYPLLVAVQEKLQLCGFSGLHRVGQRDPPLLSDGRLLHLSPVFFNHLLHPLLLLQRRGAGRDGAFDAVAALALYPLSISNRRVIRAAHTFVSLPPLLSPPAAIQLSSVCLEALGFLRPLLSQSLGDRPEFCPVKRL